MTGMLSPIQAPAFLYNLVDDATPVVVEGVELDEPSHLGVVRASIRVYHLPGAIPCLHYTV